MSTNPRRGYTLVELIVAVGIFSIIMTLASGAYFIMINLNRQAQSLANGMDNLSFGLETMTRTIRTGTGYSCGSLGAPTDCPGGAAFFQVTQGSGANATTYLYKLKDGAIVENVVTPTSSRTDIPLTDASSITVTSLTFYAQGTVPGDTAQPSVLMVVSGSVQNGSFTKANSTFTIETRATMRGSDL